MSDDQKPTPAQVAFENEQHDLEQRLARALSSGQTHVALCCRELLADLRGEFDPLKQTDRYRMRMQVRR